MSSSVSDYVSDYEDKLSEMTGKSLDWIRKSRWCDFKKIYPDDLLKTLSPIFMRYNEAKQKRRDNTNRRQRS